MAPSANAGRFRYTGQAYLPELGLYYYKARMYSPTLGRFMQTDPIGYGDGLNWYAYTHNDPVNGSDPTGLQCKGVFGDWATNTYVCDEGGIGDSGATGGGSGGGGSSAGALTAIFETVQEMMKQLQTQVCHVASPAARTAMKLLPSFVGTASLSLAGSISRRNWYAQGSGGVAIDRQGNIAFVGVGGGGRTTAGGGWSAFGGGNLSFSNGQTVQALRGPFSNQSLVGGDGIAGGVDAFEGNDNGRSVVGGGGSLGLGEGLSASGGGTITKVVPICNAH